MEIAIPITVLVAIAAIALFFWQYWKESNRQPVPSEHQVIGVGKLEDKPKPRAMSDEEISDWRDMEVIITDIVKLEATIRTVIMPSDISSQVAKLNRLLSNEGFELSVVPAELIGCLLDQVNLYKISRQQVSLPTIALFRYANRIVHRRHRLDISKDLQGDQVKELHELIEQLSAQAKSSKQVITTAGQGKQPSVARQAKQASKPLITDSVEDLAKMEATFHTKKLIAAAGRELSAQEQQKIFAEQWKIALAKCQEKYGG